MFPVVQNGPLGGPSIGPLLVGLPMFRLCPCPSREAGRYEAEWREEALHQKFDFSLWYLPVGICDGTFVSLSMTPGGL